MEGGNVIIGRATLCRGLLAVTDSRREKDKGVRLVRYAQSGSRQYWPRRSAITGLTWLWRKKLEIFACQFGLVK